MEKTGLVPENFEERVIWYSITLTYAYYVTGALYIVAPAIAWILLARLVLRLLVQTAETPASERVHVPISIWVWVLSMIVMEYALVVGHLDWELGTGKMIKSSIGWMKGWALLAIFPLIGCLPIRPELVYRASGSVCLQTLLYLPVFIGFGVLGLPATLYVSPLKAVGGPGPEFFAFNLYEIEPSGGLRWRLFTPWAPAVGFVANIYFIFALQEKAMKWKVAGIFGSLAMNLVSKSRLALVALASVGLMSWGLSRLTLASTYYAGAVASVLSGIYGVPIINFIEAFIEAFKSSRADSTRVRALLGDIAVQRWHQDAFTFGHGIVESGPHLVEYMPIGSHHSWYGLLFVKSIVGALALGVPMAWSFVTLLIKAQSSKTGTVGLGLMMILFFYTFGENLEILAYLFWPALVIIGAALAERRVPEPCQSNVATQSDPKGDQEVELKG